MRAACSTTTRRSHAFPDKIISIHDWGLLYPHGPNAGHMINTGPNDLRLGPKAVHRHQPVRQARNGVTVTSPRKAKIGQQPIKESLSTRLTKIGTTELEQQNSFKQPPHHHDPTSVDHALQQPVNMIENPIAGPSSPD